jgi:hypothetical protein
MRGMSAWIDPPVSAKSFPICSTPVETALPPDLESTYHGAGLSPVPTNQQSSTCSAMPSSWCRAAILAAQTHRWFSSTILNHSHVFAYHQSLAMFGELAALGGGTHGTW